MEDRFEQEIAMSDPNPDMYYSEDPEDVTPPDCFGEHWEVVQAPEGMICMLCSTYIEEEN